MHVSDELTALSEDTAASSVRAVAMLCANAALVTAVLDLESMSCELASKPIRGDLVSELRTTAGIVNAAAWAKLELLRP